MPVLAVGIDRRWGPASIGVIARCYAINAAGAAAGALLAGYWLIEWLGLELPLTCGALVNLGVAGVAWRISRGETANTDSVADPAPADGARGRR